MIAPRRLHPAWIILGALTVAMMAASGLRAVFGVYIKPMESEFGWSRGALSGAAAISLLLLGAAGPSAGRLIVMPLAQAITFYSGWRTSYLWLGVGLLVLVLPLAAWLIRNNPEDQSLRPYGATGATQTAAQAAAAQAAGRVSVSEAAQT